MNRFFAPAPRGLSDLLARELSALGAGDVRERAGGAAFTGSVAAGYRACLCSRIASRVLLELAEFEAPDQEIFYREAAALDWLAHIDPAQTLACEFTGSHPAITNTHYGTLRLKDAICDRLREQSGTRPDIARERPAVRIMAHAHGAHVALYLDLAGESLSRRGYRIEAGVAPLRENLAAGVLLRARWDEAAARAEELLDPLCGAGTLVIEAALIAAARAPGLTRDYFGFLGWRQHDAGLWERLRNEAVAQTLPSIASLIRGSDLDAHAIAAANANAQRAGVAEYVRFERRALREVRPATAGPGLLCTNPPYGERLGDPSQAVALHADLGRVLREHFGGWDAALLTMDAAAAGALRLRSYRTHELWNGALPCRLLRIDLGAPGSADPEQARRERDERAASSPGAQMFANRLGKNIKRLGREAARSGVSCYRVYDADMPEYAFAIDRYLEIGNNEPYLYVQEYAAPKEIEPEEVRRRRQEVLSSLPGVFGIDANRIRRRLRQRQPGSSQYRPLHEGEAGGTSFVVEESGLKFRVNLDDYLDTGLFLDHRLTRARLRERARGQRFLNLFCYTASATVYAAAGGATDSLSIDLSNGYLDWARQNFALNGLDPMRHRLERWDCLEWLRVGAEDRYGLIFLDPPTFSNSKRMQGVLDIQRDHPELIGHCMRRLTPGGLLVFACNAQRFALDAQIGARWQVTDVSAATLPFDFARNPRIHRCYEITP